MIFLKCCLLVVIAAVSLIVMVINLRKEIISICTDGNSYGKELSNKIFEINWVISKLNDKEFLEFSNKCKNFTIRINDDEIKSSCIHYYDIPVYTCKNIFINDELVCKLHKLNGTGGSKYYSTEFSSNRHSDEIAELINVAYKTARKLEKEYWADYQNHYKNENSFYEKEE
jgi:hypothetical protein